MKIAIVGSGNVGGTLASKWAAAGHQILLGVRDMESFTGEELIDRPNIDAHPISEAVRGCEVILLAVPATAAIEVAKSLGDTKGKVIIDAMNIIGGRGPAGYTNTADAILENTATDSVVKCFNSTGAGNMKDPRYKDHQLDMFMCGDSVEAKGIVRKLALDAGFGACYDVGDNSRFELLEKFAYFWINLAMFQGQGRDIGFKLLHR